MSAGQPAHAWCKIAGRCNFGNWSAWRAAALKRHGERIVPIFVDRGAAANLPTQGPDHAPICALL
jgi:hypothetical protein